MKAIVKLLSLVLALCLIVGVLPASEAFAEAYTYTVTVYSGKEGLFANGRDTITIKNLGYGATVNLSSIISGVKLNQDSKYYVKGLRLSGHDIGELSGYAFNVTGDAMYVVVYGVKGSLVEYTVNYVDSNGKQLIPSRTYYGNVGDKAVAAYEYIEGYQPAAYNLAKTLSANAAQNVFTFTYSKAATSNVITIHNGNDNTNTNNNTNNNNTDNTDTDDDPTATQPGDITNNLPVTNTDVPVVDNNQENEDAAGTQEIIDLDELETAQSETPEDLEDNNSGGFFANIGNAFSSWSPWSYIALAAGGFGGLTFLFYKLFSGKKKEEIEEDTE